MCSAIEYFLDGSPVTVFFDSERPELPIRNRGGTISFVSWGTRRRAYLSDDNLPGWGRKFNEGGWASLESIRAGEWSTFEPQPVRILAARFIQVNSWGVPCYFTLKPGEFIQGLLAHITFHRRVYVVTVPAPAEHSEEWQVWPRVVRKAPREDAQTG